MKEYQIVSLVTVIGCLILVASGFSARGLGLRKGLFMAATWAGIFAIVILFVDLMR